MRIIPLLAEYGHLPSIIYEASDIRPTSYVFDCWVFRDDGFDYGEVDWWGVNEIYRYICNTSQDFEIIFSSMRCGAKDASERDDPDKYAKDKLRDFYESLKSLESQNAGELPADQIGMLLTDLDKEVSFADFVGDSIRRVGFAGRGNIHTFLIGGNQNPTGSPFRFNCDNEYKNEDRIHPTIEPVILRKASFEITEDRDLMAVAVNRRNRRDYWEVEFWMDDDDGGLLEFTYRPSDIRPNTLVIKQWEEEDLDNVGKNLYRIYLCNNAEDLITVLSQFYYYPKDTPAEKDEEEYAEDYIREFFGSVKALELNNGGELPADQLAPMLIDLYKQVYIIAAGQRPRDIGLELHHDVCSYLDEESTQKEIRYMLEEFCKLPAYRYETGPDVAVVQARIMGDVPLSIPGDESLVALAVNLYNREYFWSLNPKQ